MNRTRAVLAAVLIGGATMSGVAPTVSALDPVETSGSTLGNDPLGVDCGTFEVWDDFELNWQGFDFYDDDGNLVRVVEHVWGIDRLYNSVTGKSLTGSFNNGEIIDIVNGKVTENGSIFRITVPGAGAVFLDIGKFIIDFEDGLEFLAGRHDYFDGDTDALCAALA